jgi:hypothetical protein
VPNVDGPNFIKGTLLYIEAQTDPNTMMVGDFNSPFSSVGDNPDKKTK